MNKVYYIFELFVIFCSCLYSQEWRLLGLKKEFITAIAVDSSNPDIIYAGSAGDFSAGTLGGFFRTSNSGVSWDTLLRGVTVLDIDIHPEESGIIYVSSHSSGLSQPGVLKSFDGGNSWSKADSGIYTDWEVGMSILEINPDHPDTLYAGTAGFGSGLPYKSINGGITWSRLPIPPASSISSLAINPFNTDNIFFGTDFNGFIYETIDGGITWDTTGLTHKNIIRDIKFDPETEGTVYAGTSELGFFSSTDLGKSWIQNNTGLPEKVIVNKIQFLRKKKYIRNISGIIINTSRGIYSRNKNSEWEKIGLNDSTMSWTITITNNKIYSGAYGIYVSDLVSAISEEANVPSSTILYQNYPNPFNSETVINYYIDSKMPILIEIFDVLGKKIKTIVNSEKSKGNYIVNWNGTDYRNIQVSSGIYFCNLITGNSVKQIKMILLK